jgi:hypothetical protein
MFVKTRYLLIRYHGLISAAGAAFFLSHIYSLPALADGSATPAPKQMPRSEMQPQQPAPKDTVPLELELPSPTLKGTPGDLPSGPNIEPPPDPDKAPPPFMAPKGVKNVARGKKVTASVKPFTGELSQITDGQKEPVDDQVVQMKRGTQFVQIDLGGVYSIYAIAMWHDHSYPQVFHDVIVLVADDAEFTKNVRTLFNNDTDNSSGFGIGTDREYFESRFGKIVDAKGVNARYVRCYTRGSHLSAINAWQEIEVYALLAS